MKNAGHTYFLCIFYITSFIPNAVSRMETHRLARKYTSHVALHRKMLIRHVTMPSAGPLLEHQALATMTVPAQTCSQKPLTHCHPLRISHSSSHFQTFSVVAKERCLPTPSEAEEWRRLSDLYLVTFPLS